MQSFFSNQAIPLDNSTLIKSNFDYFEAEYQNGGPLLPQPQVR